MICSNSSVSYISAWRLKRDVRTVRLCDFSHNVSDPSFTWQQKRLFMVCKIPDVGQSDLKST